jgi:hypothetical protein
MRKEGAFVRDDMSSIEPGTSSVEGVLTEPSAVPAAAEVVDPKVGILESYGILRPQEVIDLARAEDLELAVACTLLEMESSGGHNIWGHDPVPCGPAHGSDVTRENYEEYKRNREQCGSQGCGPTQLTWWEFQDRADARGGCWRWEINVEVGFEIMAAYIRESGLKEAARRYNGSSAYADEFVAKVDIWRRRLPVPTYRPIKALISPADWSDGTAWTGSFAFVEGSPLAYLMGQGAGAFVYRFELPEYQVEASQASVIATLASAQSSGPSDVALIVNGVSYGTQQVQAFDPGSGGSQYRWLFPESAFRPNSVNQVELRVLPEAGLRNGLSVFGSILAPAPEAWIRVSIPSEELIPVQPSYDAAFVSQTVPTLMIAGRTYPVSVTMRNIGDQVWRPGRIRLRSEQPADNLTWGLNRVDLPGAANVDPQAEVTFSFNAVAPQTLGAQLFRWGMVREGIGPFGQRNTAVNVMVARDALFVRQSVPATIVAGTAQPASITFRNIGSTTWTRGAGFRLGSQGPADNTLWGIHRVELPHDVPPDTEVTFSFPIKAPTVEGKYNFQWQVLREQVAWLGQPSPAFEVRVMPPLTKAAVFVSQCVANPIPPGAVQVVAVTMRNVGTATWTAGSGFKLGSQNPIDNVRWGTNRIPLPHDVAPNAEVTFIFGITARDAAGTWNFQWQMLQEGVQWFGQLTPNVEVHIAPLQAPLLDLCFLKTANVAQGKVEAFTATQSSGYTAGLSSVTRFSSSDAGNGWFGMHRNGNVYFVKTRNTASGKIEVFTATRSSGYTEGISAVTRFSASDGANGRFGVLPNGDVYFVKTRNTGTGTIEAFTALGPTYKAGLSTPTRFTAAEAANGMFGMLPTSDIYFVKIRNTGSGKVEALTATSASGYAAGVHVPTRFSSADADNGTFGMLSSGDVYFIKTKNTASGKIEVFTATRASNYTSGLSVASRFPSGDGPTGAWQMA